MMDNMVQALKDKQMAVQEFNNANNQYETDIAIHKRAIAELNISRIIKMAKGELHD